MSEDINVNDIDFADLSNAVKAAVAKTSKRKHHKSSSSSSSRVDAIDLTELSDYDDENDVVIVEKEKKQEKKEHKQHKKEKEGKTDEDFQVEDAQYNCISALKYKTPTNYQQVIAKLISERKKPKGFIINWEMGLGKTLAAAMIGQCCLAKSKEKDLKVIVIALAGTISAFKETVKSYPFKRWAHFYKFATPQLVQRHPDEWEANCQSNLLILDEAHQYGKYVTASQGKRTQAIFRCCDAAWKVVAMTGTLMSNEVHELINVVGLIAEQGPAAFVDEVYDIPKIRALLKKGTAFQYKPFVNLLDSVLKCNISCLQIKDGANAGNFPTTTETNVLIEMNAIYFSFYLKLESGELKNLKKKKTKKKSDDDDDDEKFEGTNEQLQESESLVEVGSFFHGLRQVMNRLGEENENNTEMRMVSQKLNVILDILIPRHPHPPHIPSERGIIVSNWLDRGVNFLATSLQKRMDHLRIGIYTGKTSKKKRTALVHDFTHGNLDVIILSAAGSTGLDLLGATYHINMETGWNRSGTLQASRRGVRQGSTSSHVDIYNLMMTKPGDELVYFTEIMRKSISSNWPGHPDSVQVVYAANENQMLLSTDFERKAYEELLRPPEENLILKKKLRPSIDLYLWKLQMLKERQIYNAMHYIRSNDSIEYNKDCLPNSRSKDPNYHLMRFQDFPPFPMYNFERDSTVSMIPVEESLFDAQEDEEEEEPVQEEEPIRKERRRRTLLFNPGNTMKKFYWGKFK